MMIENHKEKKKVNPTIIDVRICTLKQYQELDKDNLPIVAIYNGTHLVFGNPKEFKEVFVWVDAENRLFNANESTIANGYYLVDGKLQQGTFLHRAETISVLKSVTDYGNEYVRFRDKNVLDVFCKENSGLNIQASVLEETLVIRGITEPGVLKAHLDRRNIRSYSQPGIHQAYAADGSNPTFTWIKNEYERIKRERLKEGGYKYQTEGLFKALTSLFPGLSVGIEFEVAAGNIHRLFLPELGLVPVIDGSIGRNLFHEYPTLVIRDAYDFENIRNQCNYLGRYCNVSEKCALHVHIGGIPTDELTALALYTLAYRIQGEMYSLVHPYKSDEPGTLGKAKNYSRPLADLGMDELESVRAFTNQHETIKEKYSELFTWFSTRDKVNEELPWRQDQKWNCPTRYVWFNMVNYLLHGTGVIENRLMTPTCNYQRVMPWVVLNMAIVQYATKNVEKILKHKDKINLNTIIEDLRTGVAEDNKFMKQFVEDLIADLHKYVDHFKHHYRQVMRLLVKKTVNNTQSLPSEIGKHAKAEINAENNPGTGLFNTGLFSF